MNPLKETNMQPQSNLKILAKLSAIQKDVKAMPKEGVNEFQRYKYLMEAQVAEQFKALLEKHGVLFFVSSHIMETIPPAEGQKQYLTNVAVDYEFVDVESGETVRGQAAGQGTDSGDKGVYKAITGAVKYIFMKNFLIPTGDDPENEKVLAPKKGRYSSPKVNPDKPPFGEGADENETVINLEED